jgi:ATP-dependent Lhr-like helicase
VERTLTPHWPGRWTLVHRIGVWGKELPSDERIARQARQLLQCYGIVTRQSLEGDSEGAWDWAVLYRQFQLMEMRGEVRRGYFVQGLPGVQFALPTSRNTTLLTLPASRPITPSCSAAGRCCCWKPAGSE